VTRLATLLAILLLATPLAAQDGARWLAMDAPEALQTLETFLLDAPEASVAFTATAEGAFSADILGSIHLGPGAEARLASGGTFGGRDVAPGLDSRDGRLAGGSAGWREPDFEVPAPPALREALVLGLARMGIMHNLAMLSAGRQPDRADGDPGAWVTVTDVRWTDDAERQPGTATLTFTVVVDGRPAGEAVLHLDGTTGLPSRREQTVRFGEQEMTVVERYAGWVIGTHSGTRAD
jgi:hypothetical protein